MEKLLKDLFKEHPDVKKQFSIKDDKELDDTKVREIFNLTDSSLDNTVDFTEFSHMLGKHCKTREPSCKDVRKIYEKFDQDGEAGLKEQEFYIMIKFLFDMYPNLRKKFNLEGNEYLKDEKLVELFKKADSDEGHNKRVNVDELSRFLKEQKCPHFNILKKTKTLSSSTKKDDKDTNSKGENDHETELDDFDDYAIEPSQNESGKVKNVGY